MRWRNWLTAFAVCAVAACSDSNGNSNSSYGKSDPFGEALSKLYKAMPGGRTLLDQAAKTTFDDAIGELVEYSSSAQESRRPDPGQDIELIGSARRYLDEADIILLRERFPMGAGPHGWTTQGSLPLTAGDYAFFHMQTTGEIPVGEAASILQYAIVGDVDGSTANNWQGQGPFDLDFFNNSDFWLQLLKGQNEEPRLTASRINGTTITPLETAARAIACRNALLFLIPFAELGDRRFAMPFRGTSFLNIDGNFGQNNTPGWSGDDAPSRLADLFLPSTPLRAGRVSQVQIQTRFIVTSNDFFDEVGIDFRGLGNLESTANGALQAVEFGSTGMRAAGSRLGGVPGYLNLYEEGMPAGGLASLVREEGTALTDIPVISSLFGDAGNPFTLGMFNGSRYMVANAQGPLGVAAGGYLDPTRGEVFGSILEFDALKAALAAIEGNSDYRVLAQPSIVSHQGQHSNIMLRNWTGLQIAEFVQPVQDFATNNNINVTSGDAGVTLTVTPRIVEGDVIELELRPSVGALLNVQNGVTVNNQPAELQIPFIETADIATTVQIRNGETVVLGGLLRDGEEVAERGLPWLGDVPILGELFSRGRFHENKSELLIFITPTLVNPN